MNARENEAASLVEQVRERYGRIAEGEIAGCCGPQASGCAAPESAVALGIGYSAKDLAQVPQEANLGLGCGAPLGFLAPRPGETVLDLGSGAGLDVFLAAPLVGAQGRVIGVDMTPAMLARARASAARMGAGNVEFREGRLEALPVEDASVDAVTSNCVINLVPDKGAVFREVARVLRPGGRIVVSDILLDGALPEAVERDLLAHVGCVSGAMRRESYFALVGAAGLAGVEVLRDVDYLATLIQAAPDEVAALETRTGVSREEVLGRVRSVTFRAVKPAP
ncbi:MAG: arsenite S-adenosylmethyltransferase [Acidobacteria bacterium]|nr:MAG: arsenite S-adenosylmethyltransferase [Acidobacteriota bacterium]